MQVNHSLDDIQAEYARREHLEFIDYCWVKDKTHTPFIRGRHTKIICKRIDKALEDYKKGQSTCIIITVPVRHGKTDIVSRYLPPKLLGIFPDSEVLVASYSDRFSMGLSEFSRMIIKSDKYKAVYPDVVLSKERLENWKIRGRLGETHWAGVGGGITGKGYDFGIIDDFLKNRQEAESLTIRDKQWAWFTDVFLTRRAPVSITIILATPWHDDDLIGRIKKKNNSKDTSYDPDFPKFEIIRFPARDEEYEGGYLFLERFPKKWYLSQFATLGSYGASGLMQCEPAPRSGNLLKVDGIKVVDNMPDGLRWIRVWDLASSEKEKLKTDPDYTVGGLLAVEYIKNDEGVEVPRLYVKDLIRGRWKAPERNRIIIQATEVDGDRVKVATEANGGYKDSYEILKDVLTGKRIVEDIISVKEKVIRAEPLEPIFEAGNVILKRADWNYVLIDECRNFPSGAHDDIVDVLSSGYNKLKKDKNIITGNFGADIPGLYQSERKGLL